MTGFEGNQPAISPKGLTDEDFKRLIAGEVQNAMAYIDSSETISSERYRNAEYYRGVMPDVPFMKGQSSVVSSEVSDYIGMMLPSLLRPFTSGERLWTYSSPQGGGDPVAKLISQYINEVVFKKDNRGEIILNNWAFDGLVQKNGIVKAWWEEEQDFKDHDYAGLSDKEYLMMSAQLAMDQSKSIIAYNASQSPNGMKTHDLTIRTTKNTSHACLAVIPIDEFIISRDAREMDSAVLRCHRTWAVAGDLITEGYPADIVNRLPSFIENRAELTRPGASDRDQSRQNIADPALRKVTVYEGIILCNRDGSGVREWYFKAGGQDGGVEILEEEPYDAQIFFCEFCPEPIPHQFVGTCPADRLAGIQKVNTVLTRQMLQSLYLSNAPQREVVAENILSPDQLTNFAPGASVMVTQAGSINAIPLPFTGQYALQAITYFDSKAADRTGVSRSSAGLDPDALSNQSATAANLAWNASMGRLEMVARIWAYTGMRQLGLALLKLVIAYQNYPRQVIMGDKPVVVDPRQWGAYADMEVTVSTGLGTGHRDRDTAVLNNILQLQYSAITMMGPSPLVDFGKIGNTLQRIAEAGGLSNPQAYFGDVPEGWQPNIPQKPDPKMIEVQANIQQAQAQFQLDTQKAQAEHQLKVDEAQAKLMADAKNNEQQAIMDYNHDMAKLDREHQLKLLELQQESELKLVEIKAEADLKLIEIAQKNKTARMGIGVNTNLAAPK